MFSTLPANPFPPSTEQMNKGDNTELNNRVQALETSVTGILNGTSIDSFGDVETELATKTNNVIIAPLFDETSGVYSVGDLVVYDGGLYQFTSPHETAGSWDSSEVSVVKVSEELATLKSGLIDVTESVGYTGHRNLLKSLTRKAVTGTNGITVAPTFDALGNVNSIVVNNQTATEYGSVTLARIDYLPAGTYKISGCLVPNANGDRNVFIWDATAGASAVQCLHDEETFTVVSGHSYLLNLYASVGQTIDTTLYPMIRVASDTDNTYVPYHPVLGEVANDYLNTDVESRIEAVESVEKPSNIIAFLIAGANVSANNLGVVLPKGVQTATITRVIPLGGSGVNVNLPLTVINYDYVSRGDIDGSVSAVGSDTLLNIAREYCTQVNISLTY